jgi:N-acetylmuramoyl-L-alanine amidase
MPAVLTETGFLTNSEEEMMMKTEDGQYNIASCIFRGFSNYKSKMESGTSSQPINNQQNTSTPPKKKEITDANSPYVFRVQFYSDDKKDENKFPGMRELFIEEASMNMFRYLSGQFDNYYDAETYLAKLKNEGHRSSFVVVYKNNNRISYSQYKAESGN